MKVQKDRKKRDSKRVVIPVEPARPKVVAAIPCYNEARFIGELVRGTKEFVDEVIVVDDGSEDDTASIARSAGATVVSHEVRRGAGAATRSCFDAAKQNGADVVVTG